MKTTHTFIAIAGLILIIAGCAAYINQKGEDPKTKYAVHFDTPTELRARPNHDEKAVFITALKKASWRRGIVFNPPESTDPAADDTGLTTPASVVHTITISQTGPIPNSLRVTQHVGFNAGQEKELEDLLKLIKE